MYGIPSCRIPDEKPAAGETKTKANGHTAPGEDDGDAKRDEGADASKDAKDGETPKPEDGDVPASGDADAAKPEPTPAPADGEPVPMPESPVQEDEDDEPQGPVHTALCDGCKAWILSLFIASCRTVAHLLLLLYLRIAFALLRQYGMVVERARNEILNDFADDDDDSSNITSPTYRNSDHGGDDDDASADLQPEQNGQNIVGVRWKWP